ncbi:MAG: GNAT family N-acetyltransferase [Hymenobacteraceae bacterium]|nr:GNAT family N-acetyltransferase [Hymenobacteraceae bacterium]MDX5480665.1 GNAT family N-acetyltransferase [Hymenobacteraceae bacterium]
MIAYTTSNTKEDLLGILALQKVNTPEALTNEQIKSQGFVTVRHSYDELKQLNDIEKHIIAKDERRVVAYLLAMTDQSKFDFPILIPMFEVFNSLSFAGKTISAYNYLVVGQVCVEAQYRGQGILDGCYAAYKHRFQGRYDFAITEIASTNVRSLNAHRRIGFKEIHRYTSPDKTEWSIVLWDWKKSN